MTNLYPWRILDESLNPEEKQSIELFVKLTPKAAHDRIQGLYYNSGGRAFLKISVTAPPVDGLANKALISFLSKKLHHPKTSMDILRGHTDRYKTLLIVDIIPSLVHQMLLP